MRRGRGEYFSREPGAPAPVGCSVGHRVRFSEVDAMAIAWHGRYLQFFEAASEELGRKVGLSYRDFFAAGLRAPLVQAHVDFHRPVGLGERIRVEARLVWSEAARLNTEYRVLKAGGKLAASGYTVQMLTAAAGGEPCLASPPLLQAVRARWLRGEFGTC